MLATTYPRSSARLGLSGALLFSILAAPSLRAAVSNVVVWNVARSTTQLKATRDSGYTSMTNMQLWWKCDSGANVGWDATGNARHGKLKGTVAGIFVNDPWGNPHTVASGFNAPFCYLLVNPGLAPSASRTYEFWIRNPSKNNSVFFSVLRSETGEVRSGQSPDIMRMWVQADGSLRMADRGGALQILTTAALTWTADQWYQIAVVMSVAGGSTSVKVYRSTFNGGTYPAPLLSYTSAPAGTENWLAIGGHEGSYQAAEHDDTGMPGCLGLDGNGTSPSVTPEQYGAVGDGQNDDQPAWRRACAVVSAHGQGTITLTAGKTYMVGKETVVNDTLSTTRWYEHDPMGWIVGARLGPVVVNGNGATVKLKGGMHYGGYDPLTGAIYNKTNSDYDEYKNYRDYASDPGDLLHFEDNLDVHVTNIKLHGNLTAQHWGGLYADKGYQTRQSGLYFKNNDTVLVDGGVQCLYNSLDGIGILNEDLDDTSPLKTLVIRNASCTYNGRQGLSYNCGNHLEIYDSDFSYTGQAYSIEYTIDGTMNKNYPGSGVDVEPFDRYMRAGTLFENCTFFDNREVGLLLTGASPCIVRDCTIWQSTSGRGVYLQGGPRYPDEDHFFIRCGIYGQLYNNAGNRARFEECSFIQANNAYYGPLGTNVPVVHHHAIESVSSAGSILLDACTINITQNNATDAQGNPLVTRSAYCYKTVLENSVVKHANKRATISSKEASILRNAFILNTGFTESGFAVGDTYWVDDGAAATQSIIGPGVFMEGPTPTSDRFISWGSSAGTRPLQPPHYDVPETPNVWKVLTPNAGAGETGVATVATYTVDNAFTNPRDDSHTKLFDRDQPDDWTTVAGINWVDQTIDINLHGTYNVRSVKLRMKFSMTQRPKRVYVYVGDGTTWTPMGLLRPNERDNTTNADTWYSATLPATLSGSHVKLAFENDGGWGWYLNEVKVYGN